MWKLVTKTKAGYLYFTDNMWMPMPTISKAFYNFISIHTKGGNTFSYVWFGRILRYGRAEAIEESITNLIMSFPEQIVVTSVDFEIKSYVAKQGRNDRQSFVLYYIVRLRYGLHPIDRDNGYTEEDYTKRRVKQIRQCIAENMYKRQYAACFYRHFKNL